MKTIEMYFMWFLIYSVFGWLCETIVYSVKNGKYSSRGFMSGPYCPIYGVGALLNVSICVNFDNPVLTFAVGTLVSFVLAFISSFGIEKISSLKICDRASQKLMIGGHASVVNALVFGAVSVIQVMFLHPVIDGWVSSIHPSLLRLLFVLLIAVVFIDALVSFFSLRSLKNNIEGFHYYCKYELRKDIDNLEKAKQDAALRLLGSKQFKLASSYPALNQIVFPVSKKTK